MPENKQNDPKKFLEEALQHQPWPFAKNPYAFWSDETILDCCKAEKVKIGHTKFRKSDWVSSSPLREALECLEENLFKLSPIEPRFDEPQGQTIQPSVFFGYNFRRYDDNSHDSGTAAPRPE